LQIFMLTRFTLADLLAHILLFQMISTTWEERQSQMYLFWLLKRKSLINIQKPMHSSNQFCLATRNTLKRMGLHSLTTNSTEARWRMRIFSNKWHQAVKRLIRINKSYKYAEATNSNSNFQVDKNFNNLTQRKQTQEVRSEASHRHSNDGNLFYK